MTTTEKVREALLAAGAGLIVGAVSVWVCVHINWPPM